MAIFDSHKIIEQNFMSRLQDSIIQHAIYSGCVVINKEDIDYELTDKHASLFENLDALNLSIVVVIDYFKNDYFYISKKLNPMFGFNTPIYATKPQEWFRARIHPEDYIVNIAGIKTREYLDQIPTEEKGNYKLMHELRMLNDKNQWIRLIIQDSILEFDKKGKIWLVMKVLDLAPNQDLESPGRSVLQNIVTNEIIFTVEGERKNNYQITKREKEILHLLSKGLASKQIAEELFISINTVNNHRKNILKKLKVNNASEAIQQSIKLKLI